MNLIIDSGNSQIKVSICIDNKILSRYFLKNINAQFARSLYSSNPRIENCIISDVGNLNKDVIKTLKQISKKFIYFDHTTKIPITNRYESPESLGKDRLAAAVGASVIYPGVNLLVIDFGTAVTFDFIDKRKNYYGGSISPGLNTRFKALNHFTQKLPLLLPKDNFSYPGTTTETSIITGVELGLLLETEGYIELMKKKYSDLKVILTGGDTNFFESKLKNSIFAEPDIVILGLNYILNHNLRRK